MTEYEIKCPRCPGCDSKGYGPVRGFPPNPEQLWCHNAACNVVCWDGLRTLEENLASPTFHPDPLGDIL